jgi:hypothetical protein
MKSLLPLYEQEINFNSICYIEDWVSEERGDFYFVREIINEYQTRTLMVIIILYSHIQVYVLDSK